MFQEDRISEQTNLDSKEKAYENKKINFYIISDNLLSLNYVVDNNSFYFIWAILYIIIITNIIITLLKAIYKKIQ